MSKLSKIIVANALGIISVFSLSSQLQAQSLGHEDYIDEPQMSWYDYQTGTIVGKTGTWISVITENGVPFPDINFPDSENMEVGEVGDIVLIVQEEDGQFLAIPRNANLFFPENENITINSANGDSVTSKLILNSQTIPESSPVNGLILLGCIGASLSLMKSRKNMNRRDN